MLLIYNNPETWGALSDQERDGVIGEANALMAELTESGEWVSGEALADLAQSRTVRVRDGVPVTTDGPFVEAKEYLAGICIIRCETEERALDIAARWPDAKLCAMELRPILGP
ncbi:YciI family protein [Streptosporangium sp. NPDC051023]|uniref:YciI family protein n=1 Tax=Streptosporangium sp. NPDC051023 TaxID=3155410 RepID=UPI00344C3576